jgi:hypothetical protein
LVSGKLTRDAKIPVYKPSEILETWSNLYEPSKDFFPIITIRIPDRTDDEGTSWWGKKQIEEATANPRTARWLHMAFRSGQETTIRLLAEEASREERIAVFLFATVAEIDIDLDRSVIATVIVTRLLNTLRTSLGTVGRRYHANASAFAPWEAGITWYADDRLKSVRSLRELLALCADVAIAAQSEGGLVRIQSAPNEPLAMRKRREGGAMLETAARAFRSGNISDACGAASRAAHLLSESLALDDVVERDRKKK